MFSRKRFVLAWKSVSSIDDVEMIDSVCDAVASSLSGTYSYTEQPPQ